MVDFVKKLADQRAKEALENRLSKVKSGSAPSFNPFGGRKKKEPEPPPPDISEFEIPPDSRVRLGRLISQYAAITSTQAKLKARKKELTDQIKPLCKLYKLTKFMALGNRANYYITNTTTISRERLLARGVTAEIIADCTITTPSWAFRASPEGVVIDVEEEGEL